MSFEAVQVATVAARVEEISARRDIFTFTKNPSSIGRFNEALQQFHKVGDSFRESVKHSAYLFDFERSFIQNYLNGNAAVLLDFELRGNDDTKFPASFLAVASNWKTSSVVLYSQADEFDLVNGGDEELVLISDVQIVKMLNKPVPSLVGFYIEDNQLEQLGKDDIKLNSLEATFKLPVTAAEELLEIVMRRYERASTLLTSNRPVEDWGKLLGDSAAVTAMLDRLLHHGHVLKCGPRSWRTKMDLPPHEAAG